MNGVVSPSPLEPEEENASLPETSLLDKSKFDVRLELLAIQVPRELCSAITRILNGYLLNRPRVKPVVQASADEKLRCILLSEDIKDPDLSEIPSTKRDAVRNLCAINVVPYPLVLGYTYWSVEHILKQILPPGVEVPSSFETIGHIAHLNLCDGLLAYKHLIAQVILEKNQPKIKTVVNKVGTITNEFRVPTFEVLAGEDNLVTEVKQYGATFRLDYGLVYWNSRLEHEHKRLTTLFQPEQLICDMFAGVGPFAIPAAQKGCVVYANDLNASSVRYLSINSEINRVKKNIHIYNMDARDFISNLLSKGGIHVCSTQLDEHQRSKSLDSEESNCQSPDVSSSTSLISTDIEDKLSKRWKEKEKKQKITNIDDSRTPLEHIDHIIMNLPASALEFLDIFRNPFSRKDWKGSMPWIHCYCFMRSTENEDTVIQHAQEILGAKIEGPVVHKVRDVAPNKEMLCLSFKLPESAAFKDDLASPSSYQDDDTSTADMKRQRTEIDTTSIPHA